MRRIATNTDSKNVAVPRGWILLGLALAAWLIAAAVWSGLSGAFGLISSAF